MRKRYFRVAVAALIIGGLAAASATAKTTRTTKSTSSNLLVGINDEAFTLYGDPASAFETLQSLHAQVIRVNLYWGGNTWAVANKKPANAANPGDPAYNWSLYDRLDRYAANAGIKVLLSIVGTPSWANGGAGRTHAPTSFATLEAFAKAAAMRYSGTYVPPPAQADTTLAPATSPLPAIKLWTAWNEPNNPVFLLPQYKKVHGKNIVWSAYEYARICNAIYAGIHTQSGEKVACGVTDPKGNDVASSSRSSVDPLSFLIAAHEYGMKTFDAYAHNPYASAGAESPTFVPKGKDARRTQLGNISQLLALISKYYGPKHLWITEYGYQTNPPDTTIMGVSWAKQAAYLKQAYAMARKNPRIDMMLWFLVRDQPQITGWQSGLETVNDVHKPAWNAFASIAAST
ncbi:MAG: hypothetical protein JOY73_03320 [Actinobacteria bacterium]|nr:hypothetical protein [Actinomycetota bacterium]